LKISDKGLTSSPSTTYIIPAGESKTVIKPAVAVVLLAKTHAHNDHVSQTTFGTSTEAIEVAKVDNLCNSTLMTTSQPVCVLCVCVGGGGAPFT
jgi:hypothetical protein